MFVRASDLATASLGDIADGIGRALRTVHMYRSGGRRVTPNAARALARHLRQRSELFEKSANELDRVADVTERQEGTNG